MRPSGIQYPWYKAVQGGTYWYAPVRTYVNTRWYKKSQNCTYQYILVRTNIGYFYGSTYWYVLVCTARYKEVQGGTSLYKAVHGGTRNGTKRCNSVHSGALWYKERYKAVQDSMYWYVLVYTTSYGSTRLCCPAAGFAAAILPG